MVYIINIVCVNYNTKRLVSILVIEVTKYEIRIIHSLLSMNKQFDELYTEYRTKSNAMTTMFIFPAEQKITSNISRIKDVTE